MSNIPTSIVKDQRGMMLIEVMVAILIFSIGILAVTGLQAGAIAAVADAKYRMDASNVAERLLGLMWANQSAMAAGSGVVSELPNGNYTVTRVAIADPTDPAKPAGSAIKVTVTWQPPTATTPHTYETVASVYSR